jgi:hypothetical protein
MILLLTFATIFVAGQLTNVAISAMIEQVYEPASLLVFFVLFALVVVGGWRLAVALTDRWTTRSEAAS